MTKLAYLIAKEEGFFKLGSLPQRNSNPGDLRHSPHSSHTGEGPDDVGVIDTVADGWADLERQLQLWAGRGLTLERAISKLAPSNENNTEKYIQDISEELGVSPSTLMTEVLKIPCESIL